MLPLGEALFKLSYRPARSAVGLELTDGARAPEVERLQPHRRLAATDRSSSQPVPSTGSLAAEPAVARSSSPEAVDPREQRLVSQAAAMTATVASVENTSQATAGASSEEDARDGNPFVLFLGQPAELLLMMELTDYAPRLALLPVSLPSIVQQMSFWTFSVSAAIALLNMLPIAFLDGAAALTAALDMRNVDLPAAVALPMEPRSLCSSPTLRIAARRQMLWIWSTIFSFVVGTQLLRTLSLRERL